MNLREIIRFGISKQAIIDNTIRCLLVTDVRAERVKPLFWILYRPLDLKDYLGELLVHLYGCG